MIRHYLRRGNHTHFGSYARAMIRPFVSLGAYEEAAVIDGFTRYQPELGELAASRSTNIDVAWRALGAAYDAIAARGAAMTDDELVAYADDALRRLATSS